MEWATVFGVIASVLTSVRFIPQVYKSLATRKTRDLPLTFLYFVSAQSLFLIFYGMAKPDAFVLHMNIFPLICAMLLVFLKFKYR